MQSWHENRGKQRSTGHKQADGCQRGQVTQYVADRQVGFGKHGDDMNRLMTGALAHWRAPLVSSANVRTVRMALRRLVKRTTVCGWPSWVRMDRVHLLLVRRQRQATKYVRSAGFLIAATSPGLAGGCRSPRPIQGRKAAWGACERNRTRCRSDRPARAGRGQPFRGLGSWEGSPMSHDCGVSACRREKAREGAFA